MLLKDWIAGIPALNAALVAAFIAAALAAGSAVPASRGSPGDTGQATLVPAESVWVSRADLEAVAAKLGHRSLARELGGLPIAPDSLRYSDLARLGLSLQDLERHPLTWGHLHALNRRRPRRDRIQVDFAGLRAFNSLGLTWSDLARVPEAARRADSLTVDWRHLPELGQYLGRPHIHADFGEAGIGKSEFTVADFARIGIRLDRFTAWPLASHHARFLCLGRADLAALGADMDSLLLTRGDGPAPWLADGLDLSTLHVSDLGQVGLTLDSLRALRLPPAAAGRLARDMGMGTAEEELLSRGIEAADGAALARLGSLGRGFEGASRQGGIPIGVAGIRSVEWHRGRLLARMDSPARPGPARPADY